MSNKNNWTPEPWNYWNEKGYDRDDEPSSTFNIQSSAGDIVAIVNDGWVRHEPHTENEANAIRIVSCVNACTGMSDPDKEINALREVAEACEKLRSQWTQQHVATTALDFAVVDVILALAALKAGGEGKNG